MSKMMLGSLLYVSEEMMIVHFTGIHFPEVGDLYSSALRSLASFGRS